MEYQVLYKVNESIKNHKIVVFGTGILAKKTFIDLLDSGIAVDYFADRNDSVKRLFDRVVLLEDELIGQNYSIIIASHYWKEIAERLTNKGIKNIYIADKYALDTKGIEI